MARTYYGGSFAPELTEPTLARYADLVRTTDPASVIGDYLRQLMKVVNAWWALPESTGPAGEKHASGRGVLQPLDETIKSELWELIPWAGEINAIQAELDNLPSGELRDAAFHLLWYVKELDLDREPLTLERVSQQA